MTTRAKLLTTSLNLVKGQESIDIVGDRGSGLSWFAERLTEGLLNGAWHVLRVRGIGAFRSAPLVALALAGVSAAREGRTTAIPAAIAEMTEKLPPGRSAIVIDDWDDLDDASWGVICAFHRANGVPIVTTRARAATAHDAVKRSFGSAADIAYVIELGPMRFDELAGALRERFGKPFEESTMSRIYVKSGGNVGLAVAIVDVAIHEQRLEVVDGALVATHGLWSSSLRAFAERLIEPLDAEQLDALELLSLVGVADTDTLATLTEPSTLEQLESLALIEMYPADQRLLVTVRFPILAEYFRSSPRRARRQRLSEVINTQLDPDWRGRPGSVSIAREQGDRAAQFVRLVHEQARARRIVARSEWVRSPSSTTAVNYFRALRSSGATREDFDEVLAASVFMDGDEYSSVQWLAAAAEYRAFERGEAAAVIEELRSAAASYPIFGGILLARALEIEHALVGPGKLDAIPDPADEDLDVRVRVAVLSAVAHVETSRGNISKSERYIAELRELSHPDGERSIALAAGLNRLVLGDVSGATRIAVRALDEAKAQFDAPAMFEYGYLATLCYMFEGRYTEVDAILETVLPLGEPSGPARFAHLALLVASCVLASRRGQRTLAEQRVKELERVAVPDGPLPGAFRAWAHTQVAASTGDFISAADVCMDGAEQLWERGARLSAAFAFLAAVELDPKPHRFDTIRERVMSVEGLYVEQQRKYASALVRGRGDEMQAVAEEFQATGRSGFALLAYDDAARFFDDAGEAHRATTVRALRSDLFRTLTPGTFDASRFRAVYSDLTEREREIARLAAKGLTNQQIADDLVLSVRTVESHMHRILRKTGADRRHALKDYLDRVEPVA